MDQTIVDALRARQSEVKARWTLLLQIERANTALANPDTLAFLIDETLRAVFAAIASEHPPERDTPPCCSCGRSPYLAYFAAGKQSLLETLITVQREQAGLSVGQRGRDLKLVTSALCAVIGDYSDSFATLCRYRTSSCVG